MVAQHDAKSVLKLQRLFTTLQIKRTFLRETKRSILPNRNDLKNYDAHTASLLRCIITCWKNRTISARFVVPLIQGITQVTLLLITAMLKVIFVVCCVVSATWCWARHTTTFLLCRMQSPISLNMLETHGLQLTSLVAQLEENFPPLNPHPDDSHSRIMYSAGQRSVVEWIQHQLNEENNG